MNPLTDYVEAVSALWSAPSTIAIVLGVFVGEFAVAALARPGKSPAEPGRTGALLLIPLLSTFLWVFLGTSLSLCLAQAAGDDYSAAQVLRITGVGLLAAAASAVLVAILVWLAAPRRILTAVRARLPSADERLAVASAWAAVSSGGAPRVLMVDGPEAHCFAVGGRHPAVVVSRSLFLSLEEQERASILAHEWGHLRHGDSLVKSLSGTLSRVFIFDPALRLLDPMIHRSREYAADSESARAGFAADLASALVKIAGAAAPSKGAAAGIVGPDQGWRARYPPLNDRVKRLLLAAAPGPSEA